VGTVIGTVAVLAVFAFSVGVARRDRPWAPPAPRLSPDLATTMLTRAGFPTTPHNVRAVCEHLGVTFLEQGRDDVDPARWVQIVTECEAARDDVVGWPQHVLDRIATARDAADGAAVVRLARRGQDALLATAGTGHGVFGGSLFEPLPRPAPVGV
jgi:hypothetical protein